MRATRIHLAVIASEHAPSRWVRWFFRWISEGAGTCEVTLDWERAVSIGEARSRAIQGGRDSDCDFHWEIDTDVQMENSAEDVARLVRNDLARGFDVVTSPGMSTSGVLEVFPREPLEVNPTEPFAIGVGWGGFLSISKRVLDQLPVTGRYYDLQGKPLEFYSYHQPEIRCPHCGGIIPAAAEDTMIYREADKLGYKACADPRLLCKHLKTVGLPSYRQGMEVKELPRPEGM